MKKVVKLILLPLFCGLLSLGSIKENIKDSNAYFYDDSQFYDEFVGNTINDKWNASTGAVFNTYKTSLEFKPTEYDWHAHVLLDAYEVTGSCSIIYDFESTNNTGWFAFSFGAQNKATHFCDTQAAFIFYENSCDVFNHEGKTELNSTGVNISFSPLVNGKGERCYVQVDLEKNLDSSYKAKLSILNRSKQVINSQDNIAFPNVSGLIGFNTRESDAEIYSVEIKNKNGQTVYYDDFSNSACSYPTKIYPNSKWYSTVLGEDQIKIGRKNYLKLSNSGDYATYNTPFTLPNNDKISHVFGLKSTISCAQQVQGSDVGFEIGKSNINEDGYFIGVRKNSFGFSLVNYETIFTPESIITSTNENSDLTVNLQIDVFSDGKVEVTANDLSKVIYIDNVEGYFGVAAKNRLNSGENGGQFCNFEYIKSFFTERNSNDMFQNFNGTKSFYEDDETYYNFYYNKETWHTGENIKLAMYDDRLNGNGYVSFANSSPYSALGPRVKFGDAIVRFDVEIASKTYTNSHCFGLQFGKETVGTISDNCKSLGVANIKDTESAIGFSTRIFRTNCEFAEGYSEIILQGSNRVNLFSYGSKYTFLYIIKNNVITMSYKGIDEDDSVLMKPVCKAIVDNTDGYISVFGTNGCTFKLDNLSIINLDYSAPKGTTSSVSDYQGVTRYDFSGKNSFEGIELNDATISNNVLKMYEGGSFNTKHIISSNILRFETRNVEDTLRIKRGSLTVDLISNSGDKIIIDDGVNQHTINLPDSFIFDGASFEIVNFGSELQIAYSSGLEPLGSIIENVYTFNVESNLAYNKLSFTSINGVSTLYNFSIFNLDSKVYIPTVNYNAATDETVPWPKRPSINEGLSLGAIIAIGAGSFVAVGGIVLVLALTKKNKKGGNENEK